MRAMPPSLVRNMAISVPNGFWYALFAGCSSSRILGIPMQETSVKLPPVTPHVVGIGMRGIPLWRQADSPVLVGIDDRTRVMEILAFAVDQFAETAGIVDLPHGVQIRRGNTTFRTSCSSAQYVLTASYSLSASSRSSQTAGTAVATCLPCLSTSMQWRAVAGRIGGHKDRFDRIVLDHLFQRRIGLFALALLGQCLAAVGKQIADRDHFDVRVMLQRELRAKSADAVADDPHADLAIGNRLPGGLPRLSLLLFETLYLLLLLPCPGSPAKSPNRCCTGH